jgi:hypothetical protein
MATLQQLETALVNADKAGDQDAARQIAAVLGRARQDQMNQVPGNEVPETVQQPVEPTIGQQITGAGETALALGSGATTGTLGMIGGTLKGLAEQLLSGQFGTQDAANAVEQAASAGQEALTYAPRTQAGQEQTQAVGEALAPLAAVAPMTAELGAIAQGARTAAPVARASATQVAAPIQRGAQAITEAIRPASADVQTGVRSGVAANAESAALRDTTPAQAPSPASAASAAPTELPPNPINVWSWRFGEKEYPVEIIPGQSVVSDGRTYQRVKFHGKESLIAEDQLTPPPELPKASTPPPVSAAPEIPEVAPIQAPPSAPAAATMGSADLSAITKQAATATGKAQTRAQKILAGEAAPDAETIAAAKRLGIDDNLQADHVTTNQSFRELSQAVKSIPGSAARAQEMEGLQAIGKRADDLITELGGTKDLSNLSDNIKTQMLKTGDELENAANGLYSQIRENIPVGTRASVPNTLAFIEDRVATLGGRENLSPLEKSIVKKLSPKAVSETERVPGRAGITSPTSRVSQTEVQPLYGLVDDVRKTVGQAARMGGPFKDADTGLAKKLYELITTDQEAAVKPLGMTEVIDAAKAAVRARKSLEDDTVSLFGKNLGNSIVGNLAGGTMALGKGDTSKFVKMINAIPENLRQETTASALNYAFGKATQNGSLNFNTFARWYEGLERNKQAKSALLANLPKEGRQSLEDLYRVSNGIASASKERIVTGRLNAITKELEGTDSAIQRIYDVAKKAGGIAAAEAATSSVGAPGVGLASGITSALMKSKPDVMKAADKLISDPAFIAMAKASVRGEAPKPAAVKSLAKSRAMSTFKKALNNPPELNDVEQWISGLFLSEAQQNNRERNHVIH